MGEQTTIALLAFAACHVALILNIIAISTNEWTSGEIEGKVNGSMETNTTNKGLWEICNDYGDGEHCENVDESLQGPKHKAVQGLYVTATGTLTLALVLFWVFLLSTRLNRSVSLAVLIVSLEWLSAVLSLSALILHGLSYTDNRDIPSDYDEQLAWSYWVAVAGGVVTFLTGCFGFRQIRLMNARPAGYEDL